MNTTAPTNNLIVTIHAGQLYSSTSNGALQGISTVGIGLPTTGGQTISLLPGFPTTSGPSAFDYLFADPQTLYVADDRMDGAGGIQKWTLAGGTWSLQYTLALAPTMGCRGLTGTVRGGATTLFATTTSSQLISVVDTGATSTVQLIATSGGNTVFRGIRALPSRGSISRVVHGCGQTTITTTGLPILSGTLNTMLQNVTGVPVIGLGFMFLNQPFCGTCTIGHDWVLSLPTATLNLPIPNNPTFVGVTFALQGAEGLGLGGCALPQVNLTDTIVIRIG